MLSLCLALVSVRLYTNASLGDNVKRENENVVSGSPRKMWQTRGGTFVRQNSRRGVLRSWAGSSGARPAGHDVGNIMMVVVCMPIQL